MLTAMTSAIFLSTSCTTFSTTPAGDGGTPDAGVDASALASDAAMPTCEHTFCEDFEATGWNRSWTKTGAIERIDVTAGASVSGTKAADLELGTNTPAILVHSVGAFRHIKLTARMKVVARGDGEIDLVNVVSGPELGAPGLHLTHAAATNKFAVEPPVGAATPLDETFTEFVLIQLEVDVTTGQYSYAIGQEHGGGTVPGRSEAQPLYISLGASYASTVTTAWHVRFDDITVDAQ